MRPRRSWTLFLSVLFFITLWFTAAAGSQLVPYFLRKAQTPVREISWSVAMLAEDRYAPLAQFSYRIDEKTYYGRTPLSYPHFPNPYGVEHYLPNLEKEFKTVWYAPNNPGNASVEKRFPLKAAFSALILWVLLIYFFFLGYYCRTR